MDNLTTFDYSNKTIIIFTVKTCCFIILVVVEISIVITSDELGWLIELQVPFAEMESCVVELLSSMKYFVNYLVE